MEINEQLIVTLMTAEGSSIEWLKAPERVNFKMFLLFLTICLKSWLVIIDSFNYVPRYCPINSHFQLYPTLTLEFYLKTNNFQNLTKFWTWQFQVGELISCTSSDIIEDFGNIVVVCPKKSGKNCALKRTWQVQLVQLVYETYGIIIISKSIEV